MNGAPMSFSLTEALMLAGACVLVALMLHGWWIARRARPRDAESSLEPRRTEPGLSAPGSAPHDAMESVLDALHEGDAIAMAANAHADTLPMVTRSTPRRPSPGTREIYGRDSDTRARRVCARRPTR